MVKECAFKEDKTPKPLKQEGGDQAEHQVAHPAPRLAGLSGLHHHLGNQGVQRLLAQRSGQAPFELDQETAGRVDRARSGGEPLESTAQAQMSQATGHDLDGVRVHTSPEADALNRQLNAQAFTTGRDIFFRQGAYDPHSTAGQELIAHELTHVVQQGSGQVGTGGRMTVNAPDDAYEQQADAVAQQVSSAPSGVQRQEVPEEEEELQTKAVQLQEVPEEEELQTKAVQLQEVPEEEELQAKAVQLQEVPEEEEL